MTNSVYLSTAYWGSVQYYSKFLQYSKVTIEKWEHYEKQSYRNRCNILTANGVQVLSIPIKKNDTVKKYTKDIKIDYNNRWQAVHLRTIESAYRSSAYFIYYFEAIKSIYYQKLQYLFDFNNALHQFTCNEMGINIETEFTNQYTATLLNATDLRASIHPKSRANKPDMYFITETYYQVFAHKFGFTPNLSILDLLFNCGPEGIILLNKSFKKHIDKK